MGRIVRNVKVGPSPQWVVQHLASIGQRSINNMVDASNIVMFDCGQPCHVFDLNKTKEKLIIRQAKEGERLVTLDNRDWTLKSSYVVIADNNETLVVAGVKGGKIAEVEENTKDIILEVANFDPTSIRKTAQELNIVTDAKKRFENDLSPELGPYAMTELSALILEMCPTASFEDIVDVYPKKQETRKINFSAEKMSKILGTNIAVQDIKDILQRYDFEYKNDGEKFEVTVPKMRFDLNIPEDIAEEIGRVLGYDKIKEKAPDIKLQPKASEIYSKMFFARQKLLDDGYSEVMTYVFRNKGEVSVLASASDKKFLRENLTDGLKESLKLNQINAPLLGIDQVKIFEIGTVFKKNGEEMHVAYGNKKEIKEITLEEFSKASPDAFTQSLGPSLRSATPSQKHTGGAFEMWSLFPFIARDLAVWVPQGTESNQVYKVIKENAGELLVKDPELFDEFVKDGKISYAFRLVFQSYDRTLTDKEVSEFMNKIENKIKTNNWQVR
jgi:phenylalanyl-tRNA synthetase beta chain